MYTRPRKLVSGENDFVALQKQLNNDFEVHTYLEQHQLDLNNAESYAQILNSLILERRTRSKHLLKLKTVKTQQPEVGDALHRQKFESIEQKTGKEEEITKNLERQITETKKSLNLLKGDIGFLVSRNQSAQLLGSKVNKVKIVAEDQLKRVSMAYSKDKEEIKIRNEMQKKFGKKLKNISNYESSSLSRSKQYHIESQIKKNEVYNKLYTSQQAAQNSEEIAAIQKLKEKIDEDNRIQQLTLLELVSVIKQFSSKDFQYKENVCNLYGEVKDFLGKLELPEQPDLQVMNENVDSILKEYHHLKDTIKAVTEFYNEQLIIKEELTSKMKQCEQQQRELLRKFQLQALCGYVVGEDKIKAYNQKLKRFTAIIKTYFVFLTYLEKYQKRQENNHVDKRRYSSFSSQNSIKYATYITQLHKTYQMLSTDEVPELHDSEESQVEDINNFYDNMERDIKEWMYILKSRISQGSYHPAERSTYHKPTMYSQVSQFAIPMEIVYNQYTTHQPKHEAELQQTKVEEDTVNKAQRIKLLEDVDRDYYKMIKATMKMEKENTRKNYQFQRVFKRAKYASRDDILQEKRFQASFSVLSTKQSSPALTRNFGIQSRKSSENPLSKTIHCTTSSTFKPRKQPVEPKNEVKPIVKRSLCEERQKKVRLTEKLREALGYSAF